jgi:hypothetical protein
LNFHFFIGSTFGGLVCILLNVLSCFWSARRLRMSSHFSPKPWTSSCSDRILIKVPFWFS